MAENGVGLTWRRSKWSWNVHGGSSGIGTFVIQIAKYYGARVLVTAGSWADVCINYKTQDFVEWVKEETGRKELMLFWIILELLLKAKLESLNFNGRLFIIGTMGGSVTEVDLHDLLSRRLTVQCMTLDIRS
ncbi:zeta-crystallin [Quercus suber]|uniref:Zeta-crystallin n=1 Tax=Quercus suber TaxID=58331 RepID=A0AAW0J7Z1_QUESU